MLFTGIFVLLMLINPGPGPVANGSARWINLVNLNLAPDEWEMLPAEHCCDGTALGQPAYLIGQRTYVEDGIGWPQPWLGVQESTEIRWAIHMTSPGAALTQVSLEPLPPTIERYVRANSSAPTRTLIWRPRRAGQIVLQNLVASLLTFAVIPLLARLLLRRRTFPPGHCLKCGYDLHGLPEPRCPECGTPFEAPPGRNL